MSLNGWLFIAAFALLAVAFALVWALCRDVSRLKASMKVHALLIERELRRERGWTP